MWFFLFLFRNKNHPLTNPDYGIAFTTFMASTKQTSHHLEETTDGHCTMYLRGTRIQTVWH